MNSAFLCQEVSVGFSQGRLDAASVAFGLQGFRILYVHIEADPSAVGKRVKVLGLADSRGFHRCSECGRRHREGLSQETDVRRWRDGSTGDVETFLEIAPWRVACCGGTRVESFPWEAKGHRMTRRFFERIAALCTKLPIATVAKMASLSWDTVCRIDKEAIRMALGSPSWRHLRRIGIDEVSRTGGHDYLTIVSDLETGKVVWIGDGKREEALIEFFKRIGPKICRRIEVVVSDLGTGFLGPIQAYLPHANHILDRFHIVHWLNEALQQFRRRVFRGLHRTEAGALLKAKKWMFLRARERLSHGEKLLLARLERLNRPLYRAYLLKEQLRTVLHHPWTYLGALERNVLAWCRAATRSRIPELARIGKRLRKHIDKILAAYRVNVKLGLVEALNGVIVHLRRQARGYRDVEYFKLKIFQRTSLDSNPWAEAPL